jgi:N-terminal domain of (some) glycogen debranching enzymes
VGCIFVTPGCSAWAIYANGEPWDLLNGGAIAPHAARIFQTNRAFTSEDGPIAARTLGLVIGGHIEGGLHDDFDITNNSQHPVRFNLEIAIRADFAGIFKVKSDRIVRRGRITTAWSDKRQVLRITYSNRDFCREVIVRTGEGDGEPAGWAKPRTQSALRFYRRVNEPPPPQVPRRGPQPHCGAVKQTTCSLREAAIKPPHKPLLPRASRAC